MLYRHKFHGLFIAGILRETEMDEYRRDSEEILGGVGNKCKVSTLEVLWVIAERKRMVHCLSFFCPFPFFVWLTRNLAVT